MSKLYDKNEYGTAPRFYPSRKPTSGFHTIFKTGFLKDLRSTHIHGFPPPLGFPPPFVMEQSEILQKSCLENGMKSGCRFPPPLVMEDLKTRGGKNPRIWVDSMESYDIVNSIPGR